MIVKNTRIVFVAIAICAAILYGLLAHYQPWFPQEDMTQNTTVNQEGELGVAPSSGGEKLRDEDGFVYSAPLPDSNDEIVTSRSVACNDETYVFDILDAGMHKGEESYYYYNEVYRNSRTPENLLARLKAPKEVHSIFSLLIMPQPDCTKAYFTVGLYGTGAPAEGIYELRIGEQQARELHISKEYRDTSSPTGNRKAIFSPDEEKILVAQRLDSNRAYCDFRILRLLNLHDDSSSVLVQLSKDEALNINRGSGEESLCVGADVSWLNDSTIEYTVYDATNDVGDDIEYPPSRPVKERRTLKIL